MIFILLTRMTLEVEGMVTGEIRIRGTIKGLWECHTDSLRQNLNLFAERRHASRLVILA